MNEPGRGMYGDAVMACADLVGRCGAKGFEIGFLHDDVPMEEAGWYVTVEYQGAKIITDEHRSPTTAALAMAERLLAGAQCRCRLQVSLDDGHPGCRWRLVGKRWEPGCDAEPVRVLGERGDHAAMVRAMAQPANRSERRATKKRRRSG